MPLDDRAQRVEQVDDALAMFGAECDRIVETERIPLHQAVFALLPFRLVDEEDDRRVLAAQPAIDFLVERSHPGPARSEEHTSEAQSTMRLSSAALSYNKQ